MFVARNGVFLEREFISKRVNGSKTSLEEVQEPQVATEPHEELRVLTYESCHNRCYESTKFIT